LTGYFVLIFFAVLNFWSDCMHWEDMWMESVNPVANLCLTKQFLFETILSGKYVTWLHIIQINWNNESSILCKFLKSKAKRPSGCKTWWPWWKNTWYITKRTMLFRIWMISCRVVPTYFFFIFFRSFPLVNNNSATTILLPKVKDSYSLYLLFTCISQFIQFNPAD